MKVEVYVAGVSQDVWFRGTGDQRQVTLLNCLDHGAHEGLKLKQTFDYVPSPDEAAAIELDKLDSRTIVLAVSEIKAANGGRLKFKGMIDQKTVPKEALKNAGAANTSAKAVAVR